MAAAAAAAVATHLHLSPITVLPKLNPQECETGGTLACLD